MTPVLVLAATLTVGGLRPFAPGEVTVGGEIGGRMERTLEKMLRHTDIDGVFARHFRVRKEKPDEPGGFAGYGMFLDALVKAASHGIGGAETVAAKERLLKGIGEAQTPDGRITMFSGKPGFWDNHEGAYLIQALCLDHRWFGAESSLTTARRLADSLIAAKSFATLGSETAYLLLYEETGDVRYLDWLRQEADILADIDRYDRNLKVNGVQHVYTWLARALAQLQYADSLKVGPEALDGLRAAAAAAIARTKGPYMSITGSMTGTPRMGELWDATQAGIGQWGETCASAYLMRLAGKMMAFESDTRLGDLYERVMYNAFFSAQSADGLNYRYWTPFNERPVWYDRDTYCCPNNFKREVFEIPDAVFLRATDGVAVNLYAPARLKAGETSVEMATAYPDDGTVRLNVRMPAKALYLRIPAWCTAATVVVGQEKPVAAAPGWFAIRRDFSSGVDVRLELPMSIRFVRGVRAQEGRVAVMRGPCVYALASPDVKKAELFVDLWDLDLSRPPVWNPSTRQVDALFTTRGRERTTKVIGLVRYCSDVHDRTYFDVRGEAKTVADELW